MKTVHIFSKEEQEQLLKELCQVNHLSYHMVYKIMFENLLGEDSAKETMRQFQYYLSGKFNISAGSIKFED